MGTDCTVRGSVVCVHCLLPSCLVKSTVVGRGTTRGPKMTHRRKRKKLIKKGELQLKKSQ